MKNTNYTNEVKSIISNTEITSDEIFDIEFSPSKNEFNVIFNFYRETLNISSKYGVKSSYFFFYNSRNINAKAGISKGFNIICINAGLIIWLIENFSQQSKFNEKLKLRFPNIYENLDNSINTLMYQMTMHFTFYHELAHLIQQSEQLQKYIQERPIEVLDFDLTRHKLELDADLFSSVSLASHIQQYALKIFKENIDNNKIESLIEIFASSLLIYLLSFKTAQENIYYFENSHPHPIIRIFNIVMVITDYCKKSPKFNELGIEIDSMNVFMNSIEISKNLETEYFGTSTIEAFQKTLKDQRKEIVNYQKTMEEFIPENFILAIDKWNETVQIQKE
jgi:hypothetical protein